MATRITGYWQLVVLAAMVLVCGPHARGQTCDRVWVNSDKGVTWANPGAHTTPPEILAAVEWDTDGAGPLTPWLVVAGSFDRAGGLPANNIAAWDGTTWHAFGTGMNSRVRALSVYQGELFAGGEFTSAGGVVDTQFLAGWTGSTWASVEPINSGSIVTTLTSTNSDLFVGGVLNYPGNPATYPIQPEFSQSVWRYSNSSVFTGIQCFNHSIPTLYTSCIAGTPKLADAGSGTYTAVPQNGRDVVTFDGGDSWNSHNWDSTYSISALKYIGSEYYAGGRGPTGSPYVRRSAVGWNWTTVNFPNAGQGEVTAIGVYGTTLALAAAYFPASGTPQYNGTVVYDIVNGTPQVLGGFFDDRVDWLMSVGSSLYAFGKFRLVGGLGGQVVCNGVARFDGANWVPIGISFDTPPLALASWRGDLWAGGAFTNIGGVPTPIIAHLVNGVWQAPGGADGTITAMQSWRTAPLATLTSLVVGGDFSQIGGVTASHIAQVSFATTFITTPMAAGLNARPRAIAEVLASASNNDLIVGGDFTASGALTLNHVGRWTGSAWQALGTGVNGGVAAVTGFGSSIVVGGDFTAAGGVPALRMASWNPATSTWTAMGAGFNGSVRAVVVYNGELYAGGDFTASGATPIAHVAKWNGAAWQQAGTGLNGNVLALKVVDADLVVGGTFTADGALTPLNRLALWNGSSYRGIESGFDSTVSVLVQNGADLYAAGTFAGYLAQAVPASGPIVGVYVQQASTCLDQPAHLAAYASSCAGGTYHWRRNGAALSDGVTPNGSIIQGSSTPDLFITSTTHADEGLFSVAINCACGNATSAGIGITFDTSPYLVFQPVDEAFCIGGPLTLAALGGGSEPLNYAWKKNGVAIPNGFGAVFVIPVASAADAAAYSCIITNDCGTIESRAATRTIATGPSITAQPQPVQACVGGQVTFTVAAANAAGAAYLWFRNNVPMTDHASGMSAGAVSGSATPTLHLSQIMAADGAYYQCSVTTVCTAMSVQAMLTVSAGACCPADFNGVGGLNTQDIFDFLNAWFAADPRADFNHVNGLNTQDIFDFLAAWFAGC